MKICPVCRTIWQIPNREDADTNFLVRRKLGFEFLHVLASRLDDQTVMKRLCISMEMSSVMNVKACLASSM